MQKIYCRKCGSEILRKNVLGIGHFDEQIGKYKGRSFVAFNCPGCKKVRYQFLDYNSNEINERVLESRIKTSNEKYKLLKAKKIDIDQVILFYKKLKDIDDMGDLFELLEGSYFEKNREI